jgi:hypothetical protein
MIPQAKLSCKITNRISTKSHILLYIQKALVLFPRFFSSSVLKITQADVFKNNNIRLTSE